MSAYNRSDSPGPELYIDMSDGTFCMEDSHNDTQGLDLSMMNLTTADDFSEQLSIPSWQIKIWLRVNELLCWLVPSPAAIASREAVIDYIKGILSRCLGARLFSVGAMMGRTFLQDELIQITPFLCKGQDENWFIRVNEALCTSSTGVNKVPGISIEKISFLPNEVKIIADINGISLEIAPNELASLYTSSLLEDFNTFIGCDNLFKRSILLVKAWLTYEAPKYASEGFYDTYPFKATSTNLLPSAAISTLMVWLFYSRGAKNNNSIQTVIQHPMEALGLFLSHFAVIEWDTTAVAACAMLRIDDFSSLTNDLSSSSIFRHKIEMLIECYRQRFVSTIRASQKCRDDVDDGNIGNAVDNNADLDSFNVDSGPIGPLDNDPSFSSQFGSNNTSTNMNVPPVWAPMQPVSYDQPEYSLSTPMYQRSAINILDPVQPLVNICAKSDQRTMQMLEVALKRGHEAYLTMNRMLSETSSANNSGTTSSTEEDKEELTQLRNFFQNTFTILTQQPPSRPMDRYTTGLTNPLQGQTAAQVSQCLESVTTEELEYCMRHAELVLASKITADAVAHLIIHVIEQRGPQPIGEIGKLLQEATGNPNLSKVLKSQFRGLKRLIEGYPHLLRLGDDHSFNPHVHLVGRGASGQRTGPPPGMTQQPELRSNNPGMFQSGAGSLQPMGTAGRTSPNTSRAQPANQNVNRLSDRVNSPARGLNINIDDQSAMQFGQFQNLGFQNSAAAMQRQRNSSPTTLNSEFFSGNARNSLTPTEFTRQQQPTSPAQFSRNSPTAKGNAGWVGGVGPDLNSSRVGFPDQQQRWDGASGDRRGFGFGNNPGNTFSPTGYSAPYSSPMYGSPNLSPANSRPHSPSAAAQRSHQALPNQLNYNPNQPVRRGSGSNAADRAGYSTSPVFGGNMNRVFGQQDGGFNMQRAPGGVNRVQQSPSPAQQQQQLMNRGQSPSIRNASPQQQQHLNRANSPDVVISRGRAGSGNIQQMNQFDFSGLGGSGAGASGGFKPFGGGGPGPLEGEGFMGLSSYNSISGDFDQRSYLMESQNNMNNNSNNNTTNTSNSFDNMNNSSAIPRNAFQPQNLDIDLREIDLSLYNFQS